MVATAEAEPRRGNGAFRQPPELILLDIMMPGWMATKSCVACARTR